MFLENNTTINGYGFIYELGFNVGMLNILNLSKCKFSSKGHEERIIKVLRDSQSIGYNIINRYLSYNKVIDPNMKDIVSSNIVRIMFNGYISGISTMNGYLKSLNTSLDRVNIDYIQMNIINPLGIKQINDNEADYYINNFRDCFGYELSEYEYEMYSRTGEFLKADSIFLFSVGPRSRNKNILVLDNSIRIKNMADLKITETSSIQNIDDYKKMLLNINKDLSKKTKFTDINIDSNGIDQFNLSTTFTRYADMLNEKSLNKCVQAASYAYSFTKKMIELGKIRDKVGITVMGSLDSEESKLFVEVRADEFKRGMEAHDLLEKCNILYEDYKIETREISRSDTSHEILNRMKRELERNTNIDIATLNKLTKMNDRLEIVMSDVIDNIVSTATLINGIPVREYHYKKIIKYLNDKDTQILFLTGNPGIGKTTSIVNTLKLLSKFIFLYSSCRKNVNEDVDFKFLVDIANKVFYDDRFITVNTSGDDEGMKDGKAVISCKYATNNNSKLPPKTKYNYVNKYEGEDLSKINTGTMYGLNTRGNLEGKNTSTEGVISRLTKVMKELLESGNFDKILGTFATQALKEVNGNYTTDCLKSLFFKDKKNPKNSESYKYAFIEYNEELKTSIVDNEMFDKFVENIPVFVVMIDEITGTEEGVILYKEIKKLLFDDVYGVLSPEQQAKINIKLIVADASITNSNVVKRHLESSSKFEESKIYIDKIDDNMNILNNTVTEETLDFIRCEDGRKIKSVLINANSYPAKNLNVNYNISVNSIPFEEYERSKGGLFDKRKETIEKHNEEIAQKCVDYIINLEMNNETNPQVLIYIQDISRLEDIIEKVKKEYTLKTNKTLTELKDILKITSKLNDKERIDTLSNVETAKFVFMTSSAARGISFPNAKKLMIVIQTFDVESALMEIIQVAYRMRGNEYIDANCDKFIDFYMTNTFVYDKDNFEFLKNKMIMQILSFLTVTRGALETRIKGFTKIGRSKYALIPIGPVGINSVSNTFIQRVSHTIKSLKKEIFSNGEKDTQIENLVEILEDTFESVRLETQNQIFNGNYGPKEVYSIFEKHFNLGLDSLVNIKLFKDFYYKNGMIVFNLPKGHRDNLGLSKLDNRRITFIKDNIERVLQKNYSDRCSLSLRKDTVRGLMDIKKLLEIKARTSEDFGKELEDKERMVDKFIAIPVSSFCFVDQVEEYDESEDEVTIKDIISYIMSNTVSNISNIYPLGHRYKDVPYITFNSSSLLNEVSNRFNKNYVLTSTETNLISILLTDTE